ncbi:putative flagellar calcium-binding protein [Leptomonas pyrrhocoris]|uniref:Putative flagellar calcium-binding protein n=1 Tax=Leptomonas pyrrhocoris TaxID=157538 RepID=A0A0M9FXE5_LEPPY|nr:putative flagellar calcium-binding protein [Leptomonas pyrrhocoris]XP_015656346.1 putative flagellar calcium-binding protein [Leptomonas pyrrhocoris]XP_015656347.1 putative flagellar calcium-binding protein [Leptomonas pyrrhocoris]XP_015656348.1 putative flagellar calcium-binding protein [Leptomonas pyrrhocoris]KPA77906.1 putative flagellar calcium-binding protein [Leptomonas pyrrhocoris]KPA77907.1 putative flagellar calcium-binding protein [Leptomonas pyrrhocoris]KPA77908.1 putative flage|eukprot:XP_015656345.1 putative flagellar calcium-binding protein [Leptomonas pyrrhocoris]
MGCTSSKSTQTGKKEGKTAAERKAAWESIRQRLPRQKTAEDKERRIELFKKFDQNGSGKLTFEETYKGCVSVLHLDEFTTRLRDIVKRAFNKAKDMGTKERNSGSEQFVEFLEFRLMLCYIYDYFELTIMFDEIDTSGNMLIDAKEFKKAAPKIAEWGVKISDPDAVFKEIDDNGSGQITFDEFAAWASAHKLDVDGDPDNAE